MRVLQVIGPAAGGVLRHVKQLVRGLEEHRFTVAAPPEVLRALRGWPGIEGRWSLPTGGGRFPWSALETRRAFRELMASPRGRRAEMVHLHGWRAGMGLLAEARRHGPVVWTVHNAPPRGVLPRLWVSRLLAEPARGVQVIAVSRSLAGAVGELWPSAAGRVWAIRNGLSREELEALAGRPRRRRIDGWVGAARGGEASGGHPTAPWPGAGGPASAEIPLPMPILGFMGRLWGPKGALDAIDVLALLVRAGWPAVLEVAGDGPHRKAMVQRARELGIAQRVAFLGWQDPSRFLGRIDLLLHPSREEGGFPYTIMEAMAAGVPVAAARVPAIQEVVEPGGGGGEPGDREPAGPGWRPLVVLAEPGDATALAHAAAACLSEPEETARRAQAAAEYARRAFTLDATLDATRRVYREAAEGSALRAGTGRDPLRTRPGLARSGEPGV